MIMLNNKKLNNLLVRFITMFIWNKDKRKKFRQKYLIDNRADLRQVKITGKNNKLILIKNKNEIILKNGDKISGVNISISGNNNVVKLIYPINFVNSNIEIFQSNNAYVEINPTYHADGLNISINLGHDQKCIIGTNVTSCGLKITIPSVSSCIIGDDCMFAEFVKCWAGDCHAITDKNTGELINPDSDALVIGKHCWIGESSRLLKNCFLPDNSIVAACSVVTKKFEEENIIIAGNPAKKIKDNAVWHRLNQCSKNYQQT